MKNYHYYSEHIDLKSNPTDFTFNFKNHTYTFQTDIGVFSKKYIDFGTYTLLSNIVLNDLDGPILDVGCGYGPIGIVISTIYDKEVMMVDINERAIELANKNIKRNLASKCQAQKSYLYDSLDKNVKYSTIISNPPIRAGKKVIYEIYDRAFDFLMPQGELFIVIQKKQGAPSTMDHLTEVFGNCEVICKEKGYYVLKCVKNA